MSLDEETETGQKDTKMSEDIDTLSKWEENLGEESKIWIEDLQKLWRNFTADEEEEHLTSSANAFYRNLLTKAEVVVEKFKNMDYTGASEELETMCFPHMESKIAEVKAALEAAASVSELPVDVRRDSDIDSQMTEVERALAQVPSGRDLVRSMVRRRLASVIGNNYSLAETRAYALKSAALGVSHETRMVYQALIEMERLPRAESSMPATRAVQLAHEFQKKKWKIAYTQQHLQEEEKSFCDKSLSRADKVYKDSAFFENEAAFSKSSLKQLWEELDIQLKESIQAIDSVYNNFIRKSVILDRKSRMTMSSIPMTAAAWGIRKDLNLRSKRRKTRYGDFHNLSAAESSSQFLTAAVTKGRYKKWTKGSAEILQNELKEAMGHAKPDDKKDSQGKYDGKLELTHFPGPRGMEGPGVQPILAILVKAIASVARELHTIGCSEAKPEGPLQEQGVFGKSRKTFPPSPSTSCHQEEIGTMETNGKNCAADFIVQKRGKRYWLYRQDTLPIIIEVNAVYRSDKDMTEIIRDAVQQVFKQNSKYLRNGLDFAGAGVDSFATGVIGSLAYIQVYRLELNDVGTENIDLKCLKSHLFPLMKKDVFLQWLDCNPREAEKIKQKSVKKYADKLMYSEKEEDVPYGLLVVLQLMTLSRSKLLGQTLKSSNCLHFINSGTFGNVFLKSNTVAKVSRCGHHSYLRSEGLAYKAIGHYGQKKLPRRCGHLPIAENTTELMSIGSLSFEKKSLTVAPVGIPLYHLGDLSNHPERLCEVVFGVAQALKHIHSCGVAHNDVSLANVVLVKQHSGLEKAVLVDLSLASPFSFEFPDFVGNPMYAHRDIHKGEPWYPKPFHDMAALGFMTAILASGENGVWSGFREREKSDWAHEERYSFAMKAISKIEQKAKHYQHCWSQICKWIELDEKMTALQIPCLCSKLCSQCKCRQQGRRCRDMCNCNEICKQKSASLPNAVPVELGAILYERPS